jgi:hypothetical protein
VSVEEITQVESNLHKMHLDEAALAVIEKAEKF